MNACWKALRLPKNLSEDILADRELQYNLNKQQKIREQAGNIYATSFDSKLAGLRKQFEDETKIKYEVALKFLKRN